VSEAIRSVALSPENDPVVEQYSPSYGTRNRADPPHCPAKDEHAGARTRSSGRGGATARNRRFWSEFIATSEGGWGTRLEWSERTAHSPLRRFAHGATRSCRISAAVALSSRTRAAPRGDSWRAPARRRRIPRLAWSSMKRLERDASFPVPCVRLPLCDFDRR